MPYKTARCSAIVVELENMLRVLPVSREAFRGMADLVDVDPQIGHLSTALPVVKQLAVEALKSLMENGILDSLRAAEEMMAQAQPGDPWVAEALTMRANAQIVLHRVVPACMDYLTARRCIRIDRYVRKHTSVNLEQLYLMIKYLQYVLSTPEKAYATARPFDVQANPYTCDEDILFIMARGQGLDTLAPNELRILLAERLLSKQWTKPRGEMLLIPDDDVAEPCVVNTSGPGGLRRFLGATAVVRELLYSEEILAQRRGEARGFPEGRTYSAWECISREDRRAQRPNRRARKLLQTRYLSGPVLVQVVTLLKNAPNYPSRVLRRAAPPLAELEGRAWHEDRQEWLVMNEGAIFDSVPEYARLIDASKEYGGLWARW